MFPHIDRALGLHQRLEVLYVVDAYEAALLDEHEHEVASTHGGTVAGALANLNALLEARNGER